MHARPQRADPGDGARLLQLGSAADDDAAPHRGWATSTPRLAVALVQGVDREDRAHHRAIALGLVGSGGELLGG